jgi:phage gpG-like protein
VNVKLNTQELNAVLADLENRGRSLSHLMPVVSQILKAAVDDVYDAEGPGWQDLAESTKLARRGSSYKILQDTGVMAGSTGVRHGPDWAEAFGGAAYADFHATGTSRMVKRNPFDLGKFEDEVLREVADLLLQEVAQ